jgi:hypothetical protein
MVYIRGEIKSGIEFSLKRVSFCPWDPRPFLSVKVHHQDKFSNWKDISSLRSFVFIRLCDTEYKPVQHVPVLSTVCSCNPVLSVHLNTEEVR